MSKLVLCLASKNKGKLRELQRLLPVGCELHTISDYPGGAQLEILEDAPDFAGNAMKKATATAAYLRQSRGLPVDLVLADDSGLCVDALGGRPGINSARYGGEGASDPDRIALLLSEIPPMSAGAGRTARFVCSLAVVDADGKPFFLGEENCEGELLFEAMGKAGFGYDPVFAPNEGQGKGPRRSFAAFSAEEKDQVSHRGKALRKLADKIVSEFFPSLKP